jgi:hypothetical protein
MMKILHASHRFATDISICSVIITFTQAELVTRGYLRPLKEAPEEDFYAKENNIKYLPDKSYKVSNGVNELFRQLSPTHAWFT